MGKYFGTDGFRGKAGVDLTAEHAFQVGRFLGWHYSRLHPDDTARIVIGKDTRRSSYMFENALAAGITSAGADAYLLHVTTTPCVSYITRTERFDCGVMISASHNPFYDNGIKLMNGIGEKMEDALQAELERFIDGEPAALPWATEGKIGKTIDFYSGRNRYIGYLTSLAARSFEKHKVGLDCANGSSWMIGRAVFDALGAKTYVINDQPDGVNINDHCGSTHPEELMQFVTDNGLDLGLAFDGDADRMLAVDENGQLVDGDKVIAICAKRMLDEGTLAKNTAVVTVMSNMGFFKFCEENGIACEKTAVGDRYVLERMLQKGYNIGGEQSGHVIFLDYATTGDGELSGVQLLKTVVKSGKKLSQLAKIMTVYPQVLINVQVTPEGKQKYNNDEYIISAVQQAEMDLMGDGRVLVRVSGTEPLVRVMLEGKDLEKITRLGNRIADVVRERLS